jgi:ribosomal-protein-alanine N-acetyltransferase
MSGELLTARLRLRAFTPADGPAHCALYRDPAVTRFLRDGPYGAEQAGVRSAAALARFARSWAEDGFGVFAVTDRASGRLLGQCGLLRLPDGADVELLYALERAAWGRGIAVEAGRAVLALAFDGLRLGRVVAVAHPEHRASHRVMEKLGMTREADRRVFGMRAACYAIGPAGFRSAGASR